VLALIAGTYRSPEGEEAHVMPGEGAALQVWILGSSGGESAEVAGDLGLRFAANYHVSPATVLEAADGYRAAFRPSAVLAGPTSACQTTSSWPAPVRSPTATSLIDSAIWVFPLVGSCSLTGKPGTGVPSRRMPILAVSCPKIFPTLRP